ncbi:hypothetical protein [Mycobacterium sp. URHB0021]
MLDRVERPDALKTFTTLDPDQELAVLAHVIARAGERTSSLAI